MKKKPIRKPTQAKKVKRKRAKKPTVAAQIAAALTGLELLKKKVPPSAGAKKKMAAVATAKIAPAAAATYPPTLNFMIAFCSAAEGRPVEDWEILNNLTNVRQQDLNATINDTYHVRAGVALYPGSKPNFALPVRGAALDIKNDLASKGVTVPLT